MGDPLALSPRSAEQAFRRPRENGRVTIIHAGEFERSARRCRPMASGASVRALTVASSEQVPSSVIRIAFRQQQHSVSGFKCGASLWYHDLSRAVHEDEQHSRGKPEIHDAAAHGRCAVGDCHLAQAVPFISSNDPVEGVSVAFSHPQCAS